MNDSDAPDSAAPAPAPPSPAPSAPPSPPSPASSALPVARAYPSSSASRAAPAPYPPLVGAIARATGHGEPPAASVLSRNAPGTALFYRLLTVVLLVMLLLVPLYLIRATIAERTAFRDEAVARVVKTTTASQQLVGPLLVLPWTDAYEEQVADDKGQLVPQRRQVSGTVLRTPATLDVGGVLEPGKLRVGLYEVSVYEWRAHLEASFQGELPQPERGTRTWGAPYLVFGLSDGRGLVGSPVLRVDGKALPLAAGTRAMTSRLPGVHAVLPELTGTALPGAQIELDFVLKGTHSLRVVPLGDDTRVELTSSWPHPKFDGYSPRSTIDASGFKARWEISALASNVRTSLLGSGGLEAAAVEPSGASRLDEAAGSRLELADSLSVSLVDPVDVYTQTDRASKYGILFLVLTFVGFVAFELIKRLPIHPVQYLLVGLALAIFFLMLLSLSEHVAFWQAYVASAAACIGLQTVYLSGVLGGWGRASGFAAMLTALYGVLYSLLASEDNALLMGSLLLFAVLAAIMWATRKVNWYEVGGALR